MYRLLPWLGLLTVGLISGCSDHPGTYPVTGQVLYKGQPAAGALVVFHFKGDESLNAPKASGHVEADGYYRLQIPHHDGALPGEYAVTVYWPSETPNVMKARKPGGILADEEKSGSTDRLNHRYLDPKTSKFIFRIEKKNNEIPTIELE